jgi:hypothetical protein
VVGVESCEGSDGDRTSGLCCWKETSLMSTCSHRRRGGSQYYDYVLNGWVDADIALLINWPLYGICL